MSKQEKMPFVEALEAYKEQHFVPFHTPGHKIGVEAPQRLKDWMGPALPYDLGVMYALDAVSYTHLYYANTSWSYDYIRMGK